MAAEISLTRLMRSTRPGYVVRTVVASHRLKTGRPLLLERQIGCFRQMPNFGDQYWAKIVAAIENVARVLIYLTQWHP